MYKRRFDLTLKMAQVNKTQKAMLSTHMQQNPDLAKLYNNHSSLGRQTQNYQWEKIENFLNANGPLSKSVAEWKRYNTKKKLAYNKKSLSQTGGGPFDLKVLSPNEVSIAEACALKANVSGIESNPSYDSVNKRIKKMLMRTLDPFTNQSDEQQLLNEVWNEIEDIFVECIINNQDIPSTQTTTKSASQKFGYQMQRIDKTLEGVRDSIRELFIEKQKDQQITKISSELKLMELSQGK